MERDKLEKYIKWEVVSGCISLIRKCEEQLLSGTTKDGLPVRTLIINPNEHIVPPAGHFLTEDERQKIADGILEELKKVGFENAEFDRIERVTSVPLPFPAWDAYYRIIPDYKAPQPKKSLWSKITNLIKVR